MVDPEKKFNILVLGKLGQGKSEILQALSGFKTICFPSSNGAKGHSQSFVSWPSCCFDRETTLIDSPGTSDNELPFKVWCGRFEMEYVQTYGVIDLVICVFSDTFRLSEEDALFLSVLQNCFKGKLNKTNLAVCFNFTVEDPT
jgi:GTP-binding protein EngB required for normal cell division